MKYLAIVLIFIVSCRDQEVKRYEVDNKYSEKQIVLNGIRFTLTPEWDLLKLQPGTLAGTTESSYGTETHGDLSQLRKLGEDLHTLAWQFKQRKLPSTVLKLWVEF